MHPVHIKLSLNILLQSCNSCHKYHLVAAENWQNSSKNQNEQTIKPVLDLGLDHPARAKFPSYLHLSMRALIHDLLHSF